MPPKLTKATIEDMPEVARLFRISRESELPYLPKLHTPEENLEYFSTVMFPNKRIDLLKDKDKLLGFVCYDFDWIHHLYLLPEAIGKGYGAKLLKSARTYRTRMKLWVFKKNERAIKFYEKHGFHRIKETDGSENEEKEPDILMHWPEVKLRMIRGVRSYEYGLKESIDSEFGDGASRLFGWLTSLITDNYRMMLNSLGLKLPNYDHLYVYLSAAIAEGEFAYSPSLETWFRAVETGLDVHSFAAKSKDERYVHLVHILALGLCEIARQDDFDPLLILKSRDIVARLTEYNESIHCVFVDENFIVAISQTCDLSKKLFSRMTSSQPDTSPSSVYVTWCDGKTGEIKRKFVMDLKFAWQLEHFVSSMSVSDGTITLRPKKTGANVLQKTTTLPGTVLPITIALDD
jgi:GNAT superfamily N-acetyltransferase